MQIRFLGAVIFFCLFISCNDCDPISDPGKLLEVKFIDKGSGNDFVLGIDSLYGIGSDSILYEKSEEQSRFSLPLNLNDSVTSWVLNYIDTLKANDTISFSYNRFIQINSPDCAIYEVVDSIRVFQSPFDSSSVVLSSIQPTDEVNVEIYIQADENDG